MPTEDPHLSLEHMGNGRPCRFWNQYEGGCLSGPACAFQHAPDDHSLRLKLDGANICEAQLVRIGGCPMGSRCWYSHDLEKGAALPVDDAWALKETMERLIRMRKDERRARGFHGDFVKARGDGPACLDYKDKCGDDILRELGGRRPQGGAVRHAHAQPEWQHQHRKDVFPQVDFYGSAEEDKPMDDALKSMFAPPPPSQPQQQQRRHQPYPPRGGRQHWGGGTQKPRGGAARRPPPPQPTMDEMDKMANEIDTEILSMGLKPWELGGATF